MPNLSLKEIAGIVDVDAAAISKRETVQALKVNIFGGASLPNGEFIVDEQKIEDLEFDLKFQNPVNGLEKNGNYFNPNNRIIGSPQDILSKFPSLADAFRADSAIFRSEKIEVGYNILNEEIVFRTVQAKPTTPENDVSSKGLIAQYTGFGGIDVPDIPVLNFLVGDKFGDDLLDVAMIIPGAGLVKFGFQGAMKIPAIINGIGKFLGGNKTKAIDKINKTLKSGKFSAATQLEIRNQAKKSYDVLVENSLKTLKIQLRKKGIRGAELNKRLAKSRETAYKAVEKWYKGDGKIPDQFINGDLGFGAGEILLGKTSTGTVVRLTGLGGLIGGSDVDEQIEDLDLGE